MTSRPSNHSPTRRLLDQPEFIDRIEEEIARCLRTRQHLSVMFVVLRDAGPPSAMTLGPHSALKMAQDVVRHVRRYDLVAVAGAAEVMLLFPLTTRENTEAIVARLRRVPAPLPATRSWGIATWPADGGDSAALLQAARRRLGSA